MKGTAIVLVSVLSVLLAVTIPAALAIPPANANIVFSPPSCAQPGCIGFGIQFTVSQDSSCPSGGSYSGDETVTPPGGSPFTAAFPTTACGDSVSGLNGIHPISGQDICAIPFAGTWSYEFSGSTHDATGAGVAVFDVTNIYTVTPCALSVPQFPAGLALLMMVSIPAIFILRRRISPLK